MFDGYKAQRKGMPEELAQQLPLVNELLESMGYPIITREGYEADDILGTLSALCEQSGDQCFIATGDRDSLQLIGKNTVVLLASSRMGKNETLLCDEDYFFQKYDTTPQRLVDIKALMGDSSTTSPASRASGKKLPSSWWDNTATSTTSTPIWMRWRSANPSAPSSSRARNRLT